MNTLNTFKVIAHIHTDFPDKFGIPRQAGIVPELKGTIIFEPEYRTPDALKGIEEFNYLWLIWRFDVPASDTFNATVRPPRLGGNETRGVFATRSPFRPNPIGLSSVKLEGVEITEEGPIIHVSGVDLKDNTAIFDIKPYIKYGDSHPDATEGFAGRHKMDNLEVSISDELLSLLPQEKQTALIKILEQDPRPHYQDDPKREYGLGFAGFNIKFRVSEKILTVTEVKEN